MATGSVVGATGIMKDLLGGRTPSDYTSKRSQHSTWSYISKGMQIFVKTLAVQVHNDQDESFLEDKDSEVKLEHDAYAKTSRSSTLVCKGSQVMSQTTSQSAHPASNIAWVA